MLNWLKEKASTLLKRATSILASDKREARKMREPTYKFHDLAPIDSVDLGIYESALDFVFYNDKVKNVAISGSYGAGKSSIIESYKKLRPEIKFLHISLTHFQPEGEADKTSATDNVIEGKILNQLIHQIPVDNIPLTDFSIKQDSSKSRFRSITIFAVVWLSLGLYVSQFARWSNFVASISNAWLQFILRFTMWSETRFFTLIAGIVFLGVFIHQIVKLQRTHKILRKATVSGLELEVFNGENDSFFDKYLNEVLYLFMKADKDAIVFEDIDRFDSSEIFERLHEVSRLVNNNLNAEEKPPLRFIFMLKDDIFVSKDRTKFFDYIIPIVPIIDGSNSFDMFLECFKKIGITADSENNDKLSNDFLQEISLYIDDMRLLQNICNEFCIYKNRIVTTGQSSNNLFAMIAYKNLFPRDFAELQSGKGFMFEIVGGNGKRLLTTSETVRLNDEISCKKQELERVMSEFLLSDELTIIYGQKIENGYIRTVADYQRIINMHRRNGYNSDVLSEYDSRIANAESSANNRENRIAKIESEIQALHENLSVLSEMKVQELLENCDSNDFFVRTIATSTTGDKKDFKHIKDSLYFDMLKFLVMEGYIDEEYSDYMTFFHESSEQSLKRTDKIFLRSVTDRNREEMSYKLKNPDLVASRLPLTYFNREEVLNFSMFKFLLADFIGAKKHTEKTLKFINQIRFPSMNSFIADYICNIQNGDTLSSANPSAIEALIFSFSTEWSSFLSDYFSHYNINCESLRKRNLHDNNIRCFALELFRLAGENAENVNLIDEDSAKCLVEYVSNDVFFVGVKTDNPKTIASGFKKLNVKFNEFCSEIEEDALLADSEVQGTRKATSPVNADLLEQIYKNDSYAINYKNILFLMEKYYFHFDLTPSHAYTAVMSDKDSPLAKYINNHIDIFVGVVLGICGDAIDDSEENALAIINNKDVSMQNRTEYISRLTTKIPNLQKVKDFKLWGEMLKNLHIVEYTVENAIAYFASDSKSTWDTILVNYINYNKKALELDANNPAHSAFCPQAIRCNELNDDIYEDFVRQLKHSYDGSKLSLGIDNLSIKKLSILDKHGKILMTAENIRFISETYNDYIINFISGHIEDYIDIVSDESLFDFDIMVELLGSPIPIADKIRLLKMTNAPVTLRGNLYEDEVSTHIIYNNLDGSELEHLIKNYDKYGKLTKAAILDNAIKNISFLLENYADVPSALISNILETDAVGISERYDFFKLVASKATDSELVAWLKLLNLDILLEAREKKSRRQYEPTDINAFILEEFKNRGYISDYTQDIASGKYKTKRIGLFSH